MSMPVHEVASNNTAARYVEKIRLFDLARPWRAATPPTMTSEIARQEIPERDSVSTSEIAMADSAAATRRIELAWRDESQTNFVRQSSACGPLVAISPPT